MRSEARHMPGSSSAGAVRPFMNLVQGLRAQARAPKIIVIENVTGLLTSHGGKDFDTICNALADGGYRFGAVVIAAALFVPQSRARVFIIGVDADAHIPAELVAGGTMAPFHPPALVSACMRRNPLWWRLPIPPKRNTTLTDIIEDEPTVVPWHIEAETGRLLEATSPAHRMKLEAAKAAGRRIAGTAFRRMRNADGRRTRGPNLGSTESPGVSGFRQAVRAGSSSSSSKTARSARGFCLRGRRQD